MTEFELMTSEGAEPPAHSIADFLYPTPAPRRVGGIIRWWEKRRLAYNLIIGGSGLLSTAWIALISSLPPNPPPGGTIIIPFQVILAFGIAANFFYLLGPTVEIAFLKIFKREVLPVGPALYRAGLTLGIGLTLLPSLLIMVMWVARTAGFLIPWL